jgi:hypothetical protein
MKPGALLTSALASIMPQLIVYKAGLDLLTKGQTIPASVWNLGPAGRPSRHFTDITITVINKTSVWDLCMIYFSKWLGDRLCGLVVRVPGYRYGGPASIPGATTFSEM